MSTGRFFSYLVIVLLAAPYTIAAPIPPCGLQVAGCGDSTPDVVPGSSSTSFPLASAPHIGITVPQPTSSNVSLSLGDEDVVRQHSSNNLAVLDTGLKRGALAFINNNALDKVLETACDKRDLRTLISIDTNGNVGEGGRQSTGFRLDRQHPPSNQPNVEAQLQVLNNEQPSTEQGKKASIIAGAFCPKKFGEGLTGQQKSNRVCATSSCSVPL